MYIGVRHFEQLMKGVPFFYKQLKQSIWAVHCYFIYFWEGVSLDLNSPISVMFIVAELLVGGRTRYREMQLKCLSAVRRSVFCGSPHHSSGGNFWGLFPDNARLFRPFGG